MQQCRVLPPDCLIRVDREPVGVVKRDVGIVRVYDYRGCQRNEYRVLVDRLWPRGQPKRVSEFARRYRAELALPPGSGVVSQLRETSQTQRLVLLTATRDIEHSGAIVLRDFIVGADGTCLLYTS